MVHIIVNRPNLNNNNISVRLGKIGSVDVRTCRLKRSSETETGPNATIKCQSFPEATSFFVLHNTWHWLVVLNSVSIFVSLQKMYFVLVSAYINSTTNSLVQYLETLCTSYILSPFRYSSDIHTQQLQFENQNAKTKCMRSEAGAQL